MARYHGEGDRNSPIVLLTYKEMIEEIATEGSDKRWWDYKDLFNSKSAWWRLSCVGGMAFFSQVCTVPIAPPPPPQNTSKAAN